MSIKKITGVITDITDLSKTAKDVTVALPDNLEFEPGSFVNIFMNIDGKNVRRAFSISSSSNVQNKISFSIRLNPEGAMSPVFWRRDLIGETIELMGPLGLNTADKMHSKKVYLLGFGIGVGVVKSLLDHFIKKKSVEKIIVITGSRSEAEILHKDYFDSIAQSERRIEMRHVVSQPIQKGSFREGYIQEHIDGIDFNDADVYACGQEAACSSLVAHIQAKDPHHCNFFIEAFH